MRTVTTRNKFSPIEVDIIAEEEDFEVPEGIVLENYPNLNKKERYLNYLFTKKFGTIKPPGSKFLIDLSEKSILP